MTRSDIFTACILISSPAQKKTGNIHPGLGNVQGDKMDVPQTMLDFSRHVIRLVRFCARQTEDSSSDGHCTNQSQLSPRLC